MRELLGGLGALVAVIATLPYVRDTLRRKTKPHLFSWLVWFVITAIAFGAQIVEGAGPGAWVTAGSCLATVTVVVLAMSGFGDTERTLGDWLSLLGCVIAGLAWAATDNPVVSVLLVTVIDALAYVPTFRKSFAKPFEETVSSHAVCSTSHMFSLAALTAFTAATSVYPAVMLILDIALVVVLVVRRRESQQEVKVMLDSMRS